MFRHIFDLLAQGLVNPLTCGPQLLSKSDREAGEAADGCCVLVTDLIEEKKIYMGYLNICFIVNFK